MTLYTDTRPLTLYVVFWMIGVLSVALGLPAWLFNQSLTRRVVDQVKEESLQRFRFVESLYEQSEGFENLEGLQRWVSSIAGSSGCRVTILDRSARVIADSELSAEQILLMGSFENRPEILQLGREEIGIVLRLSEPMQKEYVFVAKRVKPRGTIPAEYLRLAVPRSHILNLTGPLQRAFFFLWLAGLIGAVATSFYVVRRGIRSQHEAMAKSIRDLAACHFEKRVYTDLDHELFPLARAINDMADQIQEHVRSISDQKQQWEAVFNGMEEGVLILDSRGRVRQYNRALTKLTSRGDHCVGKRPLEVIMSNELQSVCDQVLHPAAFQEAGYAKRLSITLGDLRTYDVTVVRSQPSDGPVGAIIVFHDLTELRRLEKVRQDFVANVSHELRTPLTSMKGYVETLIEDESLDGATVASFLRVIKNNTDHMVKMVDDLLQLARLEARGSSLQRGPVDAAMLLASAWKACEALAVAKNVHLVNRIPAAGVVALGHADRLVQVFRNLLENAIHYSPENAAITADAMVRANDILFSIRDEGPGIPWQHQQRVFERFYRVEKERSSRSGSTGLGLAICRHILLNHRGRIWVQSPNPDRSNGTTFFFTLERPSEELGSPPMRVVKAATSQ